MDLAAFVEKWSQSNAAERANKDLFLVELCDALGVPRPEPTTSDPERDRYVFERDAVESVLEGLAALGLVVAYDAGGTRRWKAPARAAA